MRALVHNTLMRYDRILCEVSGLKITSQLGAALFKSFARLSLAAATAIDA